MDRNHRPDWASASIFLPTATGHRRAAPAVPSPSLAHRISDVSRAPSVAATSREVPAQAMAQRIDCGTPRTGRGAAKRHARIIARFEALSEQAPTEPLHVADVRAEIGVSARTLEYCCKEYYGISACRYLRLQRMRLARGALLAASTGSASVTEIAMQYGFWELGRFSATYRDMFGEAPSVTLRHKSGDV